MTRIEKTCLTVAVSALASPALAGPLAPSPAPAAGIGVGAVVLIGMGYRAIKRRIDR